MKIRKSLAIGESEKRLKSMHTGECKLFKCLVSSSISLISNLVLDSLSDYEYMFNVLYSVQSFVDVPEYLWYGDELVKLEQKLEVR